MFYNTSNPLFAEQTTETEDKSEQDTDEARLYEKGIDVYANR